MLLIHFFLRYLYAPVFAVSFISLALYLTSINAAAVFFIVSIIVAIIISFIAERLLSYEGKWNQTKGDVWRDIVHALINEGTIVLILVVFPVLTLIIPKVELWPSNWALWQQLLLAIIVADFGITMTHYASHKCQLLWRFHAVHHSVKRMYGFNGLMKHPLHQAIELTAGTLPLMIIGLPLDIAALLSFSVIIQLLLQHSNVDIKIGYFAYLWAIAPGHRHHHLACKDNGDVNFGLFTMFWDHLLGTFVIHRSQPLDGDIGMAGTSGYPDSYKGQLFEPFKQRKEEG